MVRVKDAGESASIEFGIGESFRNMDEMFETIEIGDQDRDPRTKTHRSHDGHGIPLKDFEVR